MRNVESHPRSELVAICDPDEPRLRAVSVAYPGVRTEQDVTAVLADEGIDAVLLATPTSTHAELTEAALRSGKHVLVEKPLATDSRRAAELDRLSTELGRILMVGHVFLYNGAVRRVRARRSVCPI